MSVPPPSARAACVPPLWAGAVRAPAEWSTR